MLQFSVTVIFWITIARSYDDIFTHPQEIWEREYGAVFFLRKLTQLHVPSSEVDLCSMRVFLLNSPSRRGNYQWRKHQARVRVNDWLYSHSYNIWRGSNISPGWFSCISSIPVELEFWDVGFFGERKTGEPEKKPRNQQQTQTAHYTRSEWNRATLVRGKHSHSCAVPALLLAPLSSVLNSVIDTNFHLCWLLPIILKDNLLWFF